jgi:hypothetical protein
MGPQMAVLRIELHKLIERKRFTPFDGHPLQNLDVVPYKFSVKHSRKSTPLLPEAADP